MRDLSGHCNAPHKANKIPKKLEGQELGWGGAYQEPQKASTAQCKLALTTARRNQFLMARNQKRKQKDSRAEKMMTRKGMRLRRKKWI